MAHMLCVLLSTTFSLSRMFLKFTHTVACVNTSFTGWQFSVVYSHGELKYSNQKRTHYGRQDHRD